MKELHINGKTIHYNDTETNVHIVDSYHIKNTEEMCDILTHIRAMSSFVYTRNNESWLNEWHAHNVLYSLGIEKERTGSVDLSEHEKKWHRLVFWFIALFCK